MSLSVKLLAKLGVAGIVAGIAFGTLSCSAHRPLEEDEGDVVRVHEAIVHGALDRGRHPAVVALVSDRFLCTAVVVAPDVVLTARHCVADVLVPRIECPARVRQVGPSYAASSLTVRLGDDATSPIAARGRAVHVPRTDALCDADVAIVALDRPLDVMPLRIARPDATRPGARIDAVGYGKLGDRGGDGTRRFRSRVQVLETTTTELVVGEATCSGDSGGPAIDSLTGEIVGILSRGSARCGGTSSRNVYMRLGPHLALIERALGGTLPPGPPAPPASEPAHDVGEGCTDGATCASGICVSPTASGPDGYCSRPCGPGVAIGGRCPRGHRCARRAGSTQGVCARHLPEDADPR